MVPCGSGECVSVWINRRADGHSGGWDDRAHIVCSSDTSLSWTSIGDSLGPLSGQSGWGFLIRVCRTRAVAGPIWLWEWPFSEEHRAWDSVDLTCSVSPFVAMLWFAFILMISVKGRVLLNISNLSLTQYLYSPRIQSWQGHLSTWPWVTILKMVNAKHLEVWTHFRNHWNNSLR